MIGWVTAPVRRVFKIVNGGTPTSDSVNWDGNVQWATPVDLGNCDGGMIATTLRTLSEEGLRSGSAEVPSGSLIVSTRAPIGYVAQTTAPMAFNQGCKGLAPTQPVDSRFFRFVFASLNPHLQARGQGSTFVELSADGLGSLPIPLPPLATQRAIADYLVSETARIDALIEKKRRMVELGEERYRSSVDQKMIEFPAVPLKSVTKYVEGPGIMAADFHDEGVPLVRISGVRAEVVTLDGCNFLDPIKVAKTWKHFALQLGDCLISASATMGVVAEVGPEAVGAVPYTGLIRFRPRGNEVWMPYVKHFLRSLEFMRQIDQLKTGTAIEHYGPTHLGDVRIPLPSFARQQELAAKMDSERKKSRSMAASLQGQIDLLMERRQALITAAVTGELTIPGVAA